MKYVFTGHALRRMRERAITRRRVVEVLQGSAHMLYDERGRFLVKSVYKRQGKARLLLIVGEHTPRVCTIITVIETSKVKKYL